MRPCFTLFLTTTLSTLLFTNFSARYLLLCSVFTINQLILFSGVHSGLPRQELTELLRVFPTDSLKSLGANVFTEACELNLVPDELRRLPLVDHCDSALRPTLSDDIWTIVQSISNKDCVPRTI